MRIGGDFHEVFKKYADLTIGGYPPEPVFTALLAFATSEEIQEATVVGRSATAAGVTVWQLTVLVGTRLLYVSAEAAVERWGSSHDEVEHTLDAFCADVRDVASVEVKATHRRGDYGWDADYVINVAGRSVNLDALPDGRRQQSAMTSHDFVTEVLARRV